MKKSPHKSLIALNRKFIHLFPFSYSIKPFMSNFINAEHKKEKI